MEEQTFRDAARQRGYGELRFKDYVPNQDGLLHAHDFSVMLLVTSGHFALAYEDGVVDYRPGETCELAHGVVHVERAGPEGARILLGTRPADAPHASSRVPSAAIEHG